MKKFSIIFMLSLSFILGQNQQQTPQTNQQNNPINNPSNNQGNNATNDNTLSGFDGIRWGTTYEEVKDRLRTLSSSTLPEDAISIIADIPGREIKIKRRNIIYRYVFYNKPDILLKMKKNKDQTQQGQTDQTQAQAQQDPTQPQMQQPNQPNDAPATNLNDIKKNRLFFVESSFTYVPAEDLEKKISEKYGSHNSGKLDMDTLRGYYVWDLQRGFLIQWIDPYKRKPFTKSLYYASKEIVEEIKSDFKQYQYTTEIQTIMDILY